MKVTKEQFIGMTYDELLAENEKLWVLNEHMGLKDMAVIGGLEKENERLKDDNAKLRELVSVMAYCNQFRRDCDGCSMNGAAGIITERAGCDELLDRLRELGVEVEQ